MHFVDIGNCIENAQSTIIGPSKSFNFHFSEILVYISSEVKGAKEYEKNLTFCLFGYFGRVKFRSVFPRPAIFLLVYSSTYMLLNDCIGFNNPFNSHIYLQQFYYIQWKWEW